MNNTTTTTTTTTTINYEQTISIALDLLKIDDKLITNKFYKKTKKRLTRVVNSNLDFEDKDNLVKLISMYFEYVTGIGYQYYLTLGMDEDSSKYNERYKLLEFIDYVKDNSLSKRDKLLYAYTKEIFVEFVNRCKIVNEIDD